MLLALSWYIGCFWINSPAVTFVQIERGKNLYLYLYITEILYCWGATLKKDQPPLLAQISPAASAEYFVAYPHQYRFIVDEPNRCRQESPFLVLMIPVALHNREARDIIRNTWAKESTMLGQVVSHYFLLGQSKDKDGTEPLKEKVSLFIFKLT